MNYKNNEVGVQNLRVYIDSEFKDYSSWPIRIITNHPVSPTVEEPAFPDPVTDFSQLTVALGFILV